MARRVFYSFRYEFDSHRASQVRNMNLFESQQVLPSNEWEKVKAKGDQAVYNWIDSQLSGKSCLVVLIGAATAGRKFINYEIKKAWEEGKGVVGVDIHGLKNLDGDTADRGASPFEAADFKVNGKNLSQVVKRKNPGSSNSQQNYDIIKNNLPSWIEEAITIRNQY